MSRRRRDHQPDDGFPRASRRAPSWLIRGGLVALQVLLGLGMGVVLTRHWATQTADRTASDSDWRRFGVDCLILSHFHRGTAESARHVFEVALVPLAPQLVYRVDSPRFPYLHVHAGSPVVSLEHGLQAIGVSRTHGRHLGSEAGYREEVRLVPLPQEGTIVMVELESGARESDRLTDLGENPIDECKTRLPEHVLVNISFAFVYASDLAPDDLRYPRERVILHKQRWSWDATRIQYPGSDFYLVH